MRLFVLASVITPTHKQPQEESGAAPLPSPPPSAIHASVPGRAVVPDGGRAAVAVAPAVLPRAPVAVATTRRAPVAVAPTRRAAITVVAAVA